MKKTLLSVVTTAALATVFASQASASTYKVQSGDSLWEIASNYQMTVNALKQLNNLHTDTIYPNQKFQVSDSTPVYTTLSTKSTTSTPVAKTYTVKSGDTLSQIASMYSISLEDLKSLNNISSYLIYPGQVFIVSTDSSTTDSSESYVPASTPVNNTSETNYKVQSGDTLSHISLKYGVSVQELQQWNDLTSTVIYVGQSLKLSKVNDNVLTTKTNTNASNGSFSVDTLLKEAKNQIGVKYTWGGTTATGGFDCSGFIYYSYNKAGLKLARTTSDGYYDRSYYVNSPQPGDLVFFQGTYKSGISHLGIYLGNNQFIHAGDNGVEVSSLSNSYWKSHFESFKRLYDL
jgi:peptidoglycan endopeptidase LytE